MFLTRPDRHRPPLDRETLDHSLAAAARRSHASAAPPTAEEARQASLAIMRAPYDEAIAAGTVTPAPDDFTGWHIGRITIEGRASTPGEWLAHNPEPRPGTPARYAIATEALLACYAHGDLTAP